MTEFEKQVLHVGAFLTFVSFLATIIVGLICLARFMWVLVF